MDNVRLTPSRTKMSPGTKILLLSLQCIVLMVGTLIVWFFAYSRDRLNAEVAGEITEEWGGPVLIKDLVVKAAPDSTASYPPSTFNCKATVDTKSLHRNIYEAEVFNATLAISGTLNKNKIPLQSNKWCIEIDLDPEQVVKMSELKIGSEIAKWEKNLSGIYAEVDVAKLPEKFQYSTEIKVRGSQSLFIKECGEKSSIVTQGNARNPSFRGRTLPDERDVRGGNRFSASWNRERSKIRSSDTLDEEFVGAEFLTGVNRYQKVVRSLKYSFIIIILTYLCVFFTEMILKRNIPMLNYFLIGVALVLFYILLLSFAELTTFGAAYIIAALMTVGLIAGYIWKMLDSKKTGIMLGSLLTGLYIFIYIMLNLSTYALLLGSLLLFLTLAALMYASLRLPTNITPLDK